MDLLRKVLYTLTYPLCYVLSLLVASKQRPPAIEDANDEKYPLPPIEKFNPDDTEASDVVTAFGEDLIPAQFIDDEDEDYEQDDDVDKDAGGDVDKDTRGHVDGDAEHEQREANENEDDNPSVETIHGFNDPLPESVKKATDSLQREIEETIRLRDKLLAAADRSQQQKKTPEISNDMQKVVEKAVEKPVQDVVENSKNAAEEATASLNKVPARKSHEQLNSAGRKLQDAANKPFGPNREKTAPDAADDSQAAIGDAFPKAQTVGSKNFEQSAEKLSAKFESLQDELNEALRSDKLATFAKLSDQEAQDRIKAVEQAITDEDENVSSGQKKSRFDD